MISIIVAYAANRVIGNGNKMIWHLPADLKHFKKTTLNHSVIMGRKTFTSMGKPLPQRQNIVISRTANYELAGAETCQTIEQAIELANSEEKFILGGGEIYRMVLEKNLVDKIYATEINKEFKGDTTFPKIDGNLFTKELIDEGFDEKLNTKFQFVNYIKE